MTTPGECLILDQILVSHQMRLLPKDMLVELAVLSDKTVPSNLV